MNKEKTQRQIIKETEEKLRKQAEEAAKKQRKAKEIKRRLNHRGEELLIQKGITREEIAKDESLRKIGFQIELLKARGKIGEAERKEMLLDKFIKSKEKARQSEEAKVTFEKRELEQTKKIKENPHVIGTLEDMRSLERNYGLKLLEGDKITEQGKEIINLVLSKNTAGTEKDKEDFSIKIIRKAEEMKKKQKKKQ